MTEVLLKKNTHNLIGFHLDFYEISPGPVALAIQIDELAWTIIQPMFDIALVIRRLAR